METRTTDVLMILVMAVHVSSLQYHTIFPDPIKWVVYDSFQSFLFFLYTMVSANYMTGIRKKYIQAWSFFMFGDFLDNAWGYKYFAYNVGFLTLCAYIVSEFILSITKDESKNNREANIKHHNAT